MKPVFIRAINHLLWRAPALVGPCRRLQDLALRRVARRTRLLSGPAEPALRADDWIVLSLVRDAREFLAPFLAHYRDLGAAHFVFLDNGSTDGTTELLGREPDVTALACDLPFARHETLMRNLLLSRYGTGRWAAMVDMDELLDFPGRAAGLDLRGFLGTLDRRGYDAVLTPMLDVFASPAASPASADPGDFRDSQRWYDLSEVRYEPYPGRSNRFGEGGRPRLARGGMRSSVFGLDSVLLTKHALLRYSPRMLRTDPHWLHGARLADRQAVLIHYKFAGDFAARVADAVRRRNHYDGSREYLAYQARLGQSASLDPPHPRELRSADQLVPEGFLR